MKILLLPVALAVLIVVEPAGAGQDSLPGNAANGKLLFEKQNCYYCHGTAGQGGRDGARIASTVMSQQQFMRYVRRPAVAMPAFSEKILPDQDLADVYAYVKALPAAKAPKDIPLLEQSQQK